MKISHLGIKTSIWTLITVILLSYLVYWKSIASLTAHMVSLVAVSDHLENGDSFHSAVHSMMMESAVNQDMTRYLKNREMADISLKKLHSYSSESHITDQMVMEKVSETTKTMAETYQIFRRTTQKLLKNEKNSHTMMDRKKVQELFDMIFTEYQKLHRHHSQQRLELLKRTERIENSSNLMFLLQMIIALGTGIFVLFYMDRIVLKMYDVTENLALHDKLTGLYNRHALDRIVSDLGKSKDNRKKGYGIVLLDIDHFKKFNDTYGHPAGDQLLKAMADVLIGTVRRQDKVIRYGGEKILIVLSWVDIENTRKIAQTICRKIENTDFKIHNFKDPKNITVSIGYSTSSFDKGVFKNLLSVADQRLYQAKTQGRNRVVGPKL